LEKILGALTEKKTTEILIAMILTTIYARLNTSKLSTEDNEELSDSLGQQAFLQATVIVPIHSLPPILH